MEDTEKKTPEENEEETDIPELETGDAEPEESPDEEPATETAPAAESQEEAKPRQPSNEIKVVINMKDDRILLGVQSPDCDPISDILTGTMGDALKAVPALIKKAKKKWAKTPRNPKAVLPEPPPPPPSTRTVTTGKTEKKKDKPSFF